jgi:hypothetical protein
MKIYTQSTFVWDGIKYTILDSKWYEYDGIVDLLCGASQAQQDTANQQSAFFTTLMGQASSVFGSASGVFNDLVSAYAPIVAAGPNQQGYSAGELAALNSGAITNVGTQYKNASEAVGENIAAQGGGNAYLPSGAQVAPKLQLAQGAASATAGQLNQINLSNYAQGRSNWIQAAQGLAGAPSVFNAASSAAGEAVNAGGAASNAQNQVSQQSNSWINAVTGLAGSLGGAAIGAFSGGSSTAEQLNNGDFQPTDINIAPTGSGGVFGTPPM